VTFPVHWVNGEAGAQLPANDRGFSYGDSVFETFRCHRGSAHLWRWHRARLQRGLQVLGIDCEMAAVEEHLRRGLDWLSAQGIEQAAGRLAVSRGPGERGYGGAAGAPTIVLQLGHIAPWRQPSAPVDLVICQTTLARQPRLAGIKHGNRLEQVLAARELEQRAAADGLQLNERGELACAVSSNLFLARAGKLLTPPVNECGIAGTVRQVILEELAARAGAAVEECVLVPSDIAAADELFLTNALQGIRSVASCEGVFFTSSRWSDNLREHFHAFSESTV
jgi:4-amino-4-deoxychorismate lyase